MIDHYFDQIRFVIAQTLGDEGRRPIERLCAYFEAITDLFEAAGWRYGCLAGNMAPEAAEQTTFSVSALAASSPNGRRPSRM